MSHLRGEWVLCLGVSCLKQISRLGANLTEYAKLQRGWIKTRSGFSWVLRGSYTHWLWIITRVTYMTEQVL